HKKHGVVVRSRRRRRLECPEEAGLERVGGFGAYAVVREIRRAVVVAQVALNIIEAWAAFFSVKRVARKEDTCRDVCTVSWLAVEYRQVSLGAIEAFARWRRCGVCGHRTDEVEAQAE